MKKSISSILAVICILSFWTTTANAKKQPAPKDLKTDALLLTELSTGKVLYRKNTSVERSMGSVTKLMTYILTVEAVSAPKKTKVLIDRKLFSSLESDASLAGLSKYDGQKMSVLDLLYGLMLPSGCDAAVVLADHIGGTENEFVAMMNRKAAELGCSHTHYADPHGLSDGNKTTAEDTYIIFSYALTLPYFRDIISSSYHYYETDDTVPVYQTNYLTSTTEGGMYYYPYCEGGKTGYIYSAGKCLASAAKKGKTELICIALGGEYSTSDNYVNNAMLDTVSLYDWAFENYTDNIHINIKADYASTDLGETVQIKYTVDPLPDGTPAKVHWTTSDPKIAIVDPHGKVTAIKPGMAKITATTDTGNIDIISVACGFYNGMLVTSRNGELPGSAGSPINWKLVSDSGIDYAVIRSGWSWTEDAAFRDNVKGADKNGIPYGISFASYADNKEEAKKDAEYVLSLLKTVSAYSSHRILPVFYDLVTYSAFVTRDGALTNSIAETFRSELKKKGYDTVIMAKKATLSALDGYSSAANGICVYEAWYPWLVDCGTVLQYNGTHLPYMWEYKTDGYIPGAIRDDTKHTYQNLAYRAGTYGNYYHMTLSGIVSDDSVLLEWTPSADSITVPEAYRIYADGKFLAEVNGDQCEYTAAAPRVGKTEYSVIPMFTDPLKGYAEAPFNAAALSVSVRESNDSCTNLNSVVEFIHHIITMLLDLFVHFS